MYPINDETARLKNGKFTAGDPVTNEPPSRVTAGWMNLLTDSLNNVIVAGSETPADDDATLVLKAINKLISDNSIKFDYIEPTNPTTDVSGAAIEQVWHNTTTGVFFTCIDASVEANIWVGTDGTIIKKILDTTLTTIAEFTDFFNVDETQGRTIELHVDGFYQTNPGASGTEGQGYIYKSTKLKHLSQFACLLTANYQSGLGQIRIKAVFQDSSELVLVHISDGHLSNSGGHSLFINGDTIYQGTQTVENGRVIDFNLSALDQAKQINYIEFLCFHDTGIARAAQYLKDIRFVGEEV